MPALSDRAPTPENQQQEQLIPSEDHDREPRTVEFLAFQDDGSLLISGRWTRNTKASVLTHRRTELTWDYVRDRYNEYSYSYKISLKKDGQTVDHSGKHWQKHAQDAINKTDELRPRIDSVIRVADPEANNINRWVDNDIEFRSLSDALKFIYLLE